MLWVFKHCRKGQHDSLLSLSEFALHVRAVSNPSEANWKMLKASLENIWEAASIGEWPLTQSHLVWTFLSVNIPTHKPQDFTLPMLYLNGFFFKGMLKKRENSWELMTKHNYAHGIISVHEALEQ